MPALFVETPSDQEPVDVAEAKSFMRVPIDQDDDLIAGFIEGARKLVEDITSRALISTGYRQSLDAFPYFTDTMVSQQAYPPSTYLQLPRYATNLWNYSQMIKLLRSPLVAVDSIKYTDTNGAEQTLSPTTNPMTGDFLVDSDSEPPRIFPAFGKFWPPVLYIPNAVRIHYTAGYGDDPTDVPRTLRTAILQIVANWYENREASTPLMMREIPHHVSDLLWSERVMDLAPTRG
jgi:uncharacterized phiE125 gp8 family phage protein